ncbi:MAG: DUF389 domain-containing protein [Winogradskyella sp.]|uniref:DUF389 domain-containing protein n=1 Tax=Winogradskyella sp. TaxID=1883156 RepID=UPI000F413EF6|nr:DUF389 domain-containing protein [Winogradskyella sp.]RNC83458.1 MAG: DUF389 domain-containing protein [Winogradskyella sp.]
MSEENKFNFSEEENESIAKETSVEEKKEAVKEDAKGLFSSISIFIKELLDFRDDTDREATVNAIKADIPFKGATAWILVCSIMVASVGLNADSAAVVIGAMLISPLMGPILGLGMSIAINDIDTLKSSLINLAVMIILSLLTAYLFFRFFPTADIGNNEIFARTKPDIRDVLIAFFGGLALIIARTKKGTIASVIFGVAIATALMPPLCVAGYGLANDWTSFIGAMYLFTINTIFIALATFIVLKVLRFPMLKYANSKKRKRISQLASLVAILVMIWPTIKFIDFIDETRIASDYSEFKKEIEANEKIWLQNEIKNDDDKTIKLYFNNLMDEVAIANFENDLSQYEKIKDYKLIVYGDDSRSAKNLSEQLRRAYSDLDQKDLIISGLEEQLNELQETVSGLNRQLEAQNTSDEVSFSGLAKDAKIRFNDLEYFGYSKMLESKDFIKVDTITVANIKWKATLSDSLATLKEKELSNWLKEEIKVDTVVIKRN